LLLAPLERSNAGTNSGPVVVVSDQNLGLSVSQKLTWKVNSQIVSIAEIMGLPAVQARILTTWRRTRIAIRLKTGLHMGTWVTYSTDVTVTVRGRHAHFFAYLSSIRRHLEDVGSEQRR
jgi:hypothetical protein